MGIYIANSFSTMSIFNKSATVILYTTLTLVGLLALMGLLTKMFRKTKMVDYQKYALGIGVGYSIAVIVLMLFLKFDEMKQNGDFIKAVFTPILIIVAVGAVIALVGLIISVLSPKKLKVFWIISGIAFLISLIISIILLSKYYSNTIVPSGVYENISTLWLTVGALVLLVVMAIIYLLFGKNSAKNNHTKAIVYAAICIALGFALSYLRLFRLPQGGSVTLVSLLPLMLYSYMFGIRKGILAGFIYGILQAIQDPFIIHPVQFLLDYPIAFAMIGVTGMFKGFAKKPIIPFILGSIVAALLRYASHVISGIFAFSSFAGAGYSAVAWGFLYNTFSLVDIALAIVAGVLLLANKGFFKQISSANKE